MNLDIDGLTVIAGRNGTGKSTVLGSIFHMLGPSENIDDGGPGRTTEPSILTYEGGKGTITSTSRHDAPNGMFQDLPGAILYDTPHIIDGALDDPSTPRGRLASLLRTECPDIGDRTRSCKGCDAFMRYIEDLVPGRMWYDADDGCFMYSEDGGGTIRARDLPDGMKPFCIIRTLVEQGRIEQDSVVLLDRPEQCLHPDWQVRMAQTIASLRKNIGCRIVLTTDSPLLLRGIQAYAAVMDESIHHYLMERGEAGRIRCIDLGPDPGRIYDEMADAFELAENLYYRDRDER